MVMQVYGFNYQNIFFLLSVQAAIPIDPKTGLDNPNLNGYFTFNASDPRFGNPYIPLNASACNRSTVFPNWLSTTNNNWDLRGFYL